MSSMYTWHIGSTWYTPDLDVVTTDISIFFSHRGKVYFPGLKKSVYNVCQGVNSLSHAAASVADGLPARCFLRGPKKWKYRRETERSITTLTDFIILTVQSYYLLYTYSIPTKLHFILLS